MTKDQFSELVRQYERLVYTVCFQLVRDGPAAPAFWPIITRGGCSVRSFSAAPEFASWGEMIGAKSELSDGQIEERQKKQEKFKTFSCFFYALML